jgi:uncharacterized protein YbaP (TraB family)
MAGRIPAPVRRSIAVAGGSFFVALALLLVLGAGGCTPQKKGSAGILYRVTGGKSDLYLLGSIHVGSEDMYPMGQHILDAMEAADVLAFECDTASAQAQAAYQELMRCPEGDTLESRVSADTYALVRQAAQKRGRLEGAASGGDAKFCVWQGFTGRPAL